MKNILLAKPKIAHHPLLRLKLWQDNKKKKKNDDHNLTAVLRRGGVAGKSEVRVLWFPQDSGGQSLSNSGVLL